MEVAAILRSARFASWSYRLISTAVGFLSIRLIIEAVGTDGYGHVALALALLTTIGAIDFGFLQALPRFVARMERTGDSGAFWATSLAATAALLLFQLLALACSAVAVDAVDHIEDLSTSSLVFGGILYVSGTALSVSGAIFAGFQRYVSAAVGKICRSLFYIALVAAFTALGILTVDRTVMIYATTFFIANATMAIVLFMHMRVRSSPDWEGFPARHLPILRDIGSYSLRGWAFTLSTVLLTSASVTLGGMLRPATDIAVLQIALVAMTGLFAIVTGSMVPLTTIIARWSDGTADGEARIVLAARSLIFDAIFFAATILIFFANFGRPALALLVGAGHGTNDVTSAYTLLMTVLCPAAIALPLFTYRFGLISDDQNARFSLWSCVVAAAAVATGAALVVMLDSVLPLAAAIGIGFASRSALAYAMGAKIVPGPPLTRIVGAMILVLAVLEVAALVVMRIPIALRLGELQTPHFQAALFGIVAFAFYLLRRRLPATARI